MKDRLLETLWVLPKLAFCLLLGVPKLFLLPLVAYVYWVVTGEQSDGWYFKDDATGKLIEVTGTIVIEQE